MFEVNDNLFHMVGYGELQKMMTIEGYKVDGGELKLFYPERFLNTLEQRALMLRLEKVGYDDVYIVTHSVYIIQCTHKENILVIHQSEGKEPQEGDFILTNNLNCMADDSGLNVLGGSIKR